MADLTQYQSADVTKMSAVVEAVERYIYDHLRNPVMPNEKERKVLLEEAAVDMRAALELRRASEAATYLPGEDLSGPGVDTVDLSKTGDEEEESNGDDSGESEYESASASDSSSPDASQDVTKRRVKRKK